MNLEIRSDYGSAKELAEAAAKDLAAQILGLLESRGRADIVLTGGTVGTLTLEYLATELAKHDLENLHFWWSDERFVNRESPDRNYVQADKALLSKISIPAQNLHQFPAAETGDLTSATESFRILIEQQAPRFDVVLLGMGQDGHIASLFPGSNATVHGDYLVSESNSPKLPPKRISLSMSALSAANQVWLLVSGSDKAEAVQMVFASEDLPAAHVRGKNLTRWYLDKEAAAGITS